MPLPLFTVFGLVTYDLIRSVFTARTDIKKGAPVKVRPKLIKPLSASVILF